MGGFVMKKKIVSTVLCSAMTVAMLAGCGSGSSSSSSTSTAADSTATAAAATAETAAVGEGNTEAESTGEPITLRMAWWGSQDRHDKTIAAIELYEKENPNVTIEYEFYSFDDYFTKLKTLVASDEVWDIFQLGGNFPMYMDKIYPLDEFIDSGVVDVSKFSDANLKTTQTTDGKQLGLTNGINTYGIAYDPAMFEEAGVDLPTDTWTWDDYKNAADTITESSMISPKRVRTHVMATASPRLLFFLPPILLFCLPPILLFCSFFSKKLTAGART